MKPVYEVVSGSILLSKREDVFRLHRDWLLPMMHKIGIRPFLLLMTEIDWQLWQVPGHLPLRQSRAV
jgi:hypothetical protein